MQEFLEYLKKKGVQKNSRKTYVKAVRLYLKNYQNPLESNNIADFIFSRISLHHRYALQHYFTFIKQQKIFKKTMRKHKDALRQQRRNQGKTKIKHVLNKKQIRNLLNYLRDPFNIIAEIQYTTASRSSAIVNLRFNLVQEDDDGQTFLTIVEKGNKQRTIYLFKKTAKRLRDYMKKYSYDPNDHVFKKIGKTNYMRYWYYNKELNNAGLELFGHRISTHTLRRSRAVYYLQSGYDLTTVQSVLGHSNIENTIPYVEQAALTSKEIMLKEQQKVI